MRTDVCVTEHKEQHAKPDITRRHSKLKLDQALASPSRTQDWNVGMRRGSNRTPSLQNSATQTDGTCLRVDPHMEGMSSGAVGHSARIPPGTPVVVYIRAGQGGRGRWHKNDARLGLLQAHFLWQV